MVRKLVRLHNSLMYIKAEEKRSDEIQDFVKDTSGRINSISKIHDHLLSTEAIGVVNIKSYLEELINSLLILYQSKEYILLDADIAPLHLPIDFVMKVGLIVNEVITNILKHAYPEGKGEIFVKLYQNKHLFLEIADTGIGFDISKVDVNSYGISIINLITDELNGQVTVSRSVGVCYTFKFETNQKNITR